MLHAGGAAAAAGGAAAAAGSKGGKVAKAKGAKDSGGKPTAKGDGEASPL